jgi:hypothetical protein
MPERLVTINLYGDHRLASRDSRRLSRAGLNPYLAGQYFRFHRPVELQVPESEAEKALRVLNLDQTPEDLKRASETLPCPECGAPVVRRYPPWGTYLFLVAIAAFVLFVVLGKWEIGLVMFMICFYVAGLVAWKFGRYRCRVCKWDWEPS